MKSYKEILEGWYQKPASAYRRKGDEVRDELKGKQHKIDKNKNGKIDAHDFKLLRKEENELVEATVKTQKYSWGTMKTVHHGADFSIPLHPEHHKEIAKLKDEQEHHFKTEDGKHWTARRKGDEVHFQGANGGNSTKVPHSTMKEEYENEVLSEEDHSELSRIAAANYRKALARGDSVAANAANAEHIRHKKAAMAMRKKSHTPGEMDEEVELSEEHLVHVSDGSKYGEQPSKKDTEHVMSGVKAHGGEFDGHSDKGAYFKFKSHNDAKNFKRHVDSCPNKTCYADLHEAVDFNKWVSGGKQTTPKQKPVVEKEPENTIKGSQIKFLNTFKEDTDLNEKMNLAKADMGDVIKDFQKSDAPQFAGKTKEKKRQMAIAAKLEADRQQNEGVIQPSGTDAMEVGIDKPKDTVVRDKKGNLISFKHEGAWKKSTGTVTDKSGAKHSPMSQARHLARSAMKTVKEETEDLEEGYVVRYNNPKSEKHGGEKHFDNQDSAKKHADHGNSVDKIGGKYTVHKTNEKGHDIKEQAPVAPVPGQKWKDHAVMVNGRQRVVIHRKNIGNYSKEEGWKEVAPGQKVKEDIDLDGNYVSEPMSYQEFAMMIEGRAQYMVKATHNKTGNTKVSTYVADKDESEYGVRSRAEREHKPMGYTIDSVRRKDVEAHGEDDEDETVSTQKRGRGRPAGSKSGARGPRIK